MGEKCIFNPVTKRMYILSGETEIDVGVDLYSDAKEDWLNDDSLHKFKFPFRVIGGDPTVTGQFIEPYFFLLYDWYIKPYEADHELNLLGNIFRDGGGAIAVPTSGEYTVIVNRLTTITRVEEEAGSGSLTQEQHDQLMSLPDLSEIEGSTVIAKESSVDALPVLGEIEASGVLAKEATSQQISGEVVELPTLGEIEASSVLAKEATVDALPTLAEIEASNVLAKQTELLEALGLAQSNYYLDQATYDTYEGQKLLTAGRIRTYSNPASVGTSNDVLATYLITATWTDNELQTYKVVKQ